MGNFKFNKRPLQENKIKGSKIASFFGTPEMIRTSDARFRKPTLYPLSYGGISQALL